MPLDVAGHGESVHFSAFVAQESGQLFIRDDDPAVSRLLQVVLLDVGPGEPQKFRSGGKVFSGDCSQRAIRLEAFVHLGRAAVGSGVSPPLRLPSLAGSSLVLSHGFGRRWRKRDDLISEGVFLDGVAHGEAVDEDAHLAHELGELGVRPEESPIFLVLEVVLLDVGPQRLVVLSPGSSLKSGQLEEDVVGDDVDGDVAPASIFGGVRAVDDASPRPEGVSPWLGFVCFSIRHHF